MARNYMQDITPPDGPARKTRSRKTRPPEPETVPEAEIDEQETESESEPMERSIRSIKPSPSRLRLPREMPEHAHAHTTRRVPHKRQRIGVWVAATLAILVVALAAILMLFPSTSVTVVPRTQIVSFDSSSPFTAYPDASAADGTIRYTVLTQTFEDSAVVPASGTEHVEEQASGKLIVYNAFSDKAVPLIKNTRFQTPEGLIFRIAESIEIPGRNGSTPGSLEVDAYADQAGPEYNIGPVSRFTVPGLRTSEMYEDIYAESKTAFAGGFSGERPAVTDAVLETAQAEVRDRLMEKARQLSLTAPEGSVAFPGLMAVRFETLPPTQEGSGSVRINEKAVVAIPVFPEERLAQSIGQAVSASAEGQSVQIRFADSLQAAPVDGLDAADLGTEPVVFTLGGRGQLVWNVDAAALAEALGGRDEAAFETIVQGFPSIAEARARIMPFWKSSFPKAADIDVIIDPPPAF